MRQAVLLGCAVCVVCGAALAIRQRRSPERRDEAQPGTRPVTAPRDEVKAERAEEEIKTPPPQQQVQSKAVRVDLSADQRQMLCTCGQSAAFPLCDNAHRAYNASNKTSYQPVPVEGPVQLEWIRCQDRKEISIGTRKSELAMWQARFVQNKLMAIYPDRIFSVKGITTMGDADQMKPLSSFEARGVFTKELDIATLDGTVDLAVHCVKDLPTTLPKGLVMGCILERGDVEDGVIFHEKHKGQTLASLPAGACIGTSALRRAAVLLRKFPHLTFQNIRGNVQTRLAKLDRGEYDAIILAVVGLKRLGNEERIGQVLDAQEFGHAVGQGALAVVGRSSDVLLMDGRGLLRTLEHLPTRLTCEAERALLRKLEGGCKVPLAVRYTLKMNDQNRPCGLELTGLVYSRDGTQCVSSTQEVKFETIDRSRAIATCVELGNAVAQDLLSNGAAAILNDVRSHVEEKP